MSTDCGKCAGQMVRKGVICSKCFKHFHGYCVDAPIKSENWLCSFCDSTIQSMQSKSTANNLPLPDTQALLEKLQDEVRLIKSKHVEFMNTYVLLIEKHDEFSNLLSSFDNKCQIIVNLEAKVADLELKITDVSTKQKCDSDQLNFMTKRMNAMESYSYKCNLELRGIPQVNNENLINIFSNICSKVNFEVQDSYIKYIHRTKSKSAIKPVIVELHSKFAKDNFLLACKKAGKIMAKDIGFGNTGNIISIYEHLPLWKKKLLFEAKVLHNDGYNFKYVWSKYGKIFCKLNDAAKTIQIDSFNALQDLLSTTNADIPTSMSSLTSSELFLHQTSRD